ncbi:MAG: bifunctional oligoribonuclease/PAP phosphatase NrnA [Anaerolineales bacterium]|nr:bifunctional oligoribonuclease/PAP phosphatase NrnA [Anaerolineales bacterium]
MNDLQKKIKDRIQAAQRVLVTSHVRPDGDAIGSSLAFALALLDAGKQVQVVLSDGLPASFKQLPGADMVRTKADGEFDLIVSVDCSDLKRIGDSLDGYHAPDIIIDHHVTAEAFGTLNLVEPEAVATASVLMRHMHAWGLAITTPIAANLMTGLVTDTLGFRTSNTSPESLRQAADLLELGVDMSTLYYRSLVRRTFVEAKYWGAGLTSLERADGIIWATLTVADRKASGYTGKDDADLINIVSSIDDAEVAILFVEQNAEKTKISWRGLKPHVDVSQLARQFNGGGHKAASGAELSGSLDEVRERVLEATRKILLLHE